MLLNLDLIDLETLKSKMGNNPIKITLEDEKGKKSEYILNFDLIN